MKEYTGGKDGRGYVVGVPTRDLTEAEWRALTGTQRRLAKGFYKNGGAGGSNDGEEGEGETANESGVSNGN